MISQPIVDQLETGALPVADFDHLRHVEAAWELLEERPFLDAARRFVDVVSEKVAAAGAADKFNLTLTLAFLGVIAERRLDTPAPSFAEFLAANPDLKSNVIRRWYSPDRLWSARARQTFVLPDCVPGQPS